MRTRALAVIGCLASTIVFTQSTDYAIKMYRPATVGDVYVYTATATGEQSVVTTVDGQPGPSQTQTSTIEVTAHATTLAVSPIGKEIKVSLVIDQSKCAMDGVTSEIVPAATTVIADRNATPRFSINGNGVSDRAAKCLQQILQFGSTSETTDDDIFGTKAKQKVGASWPINAALAAKDLFSDAELAVDGKNITGTTRLADIVTLADRPAMRLVGELTMSGVRIPLPPGVNVTSSDFRATMSATVPVDVARRDATSTMSMTGRVECNGDANGHSLGMKLSMTQKVENSITIK